MCRVCWGKAASWSQPSQLSCNSCVWTMETKGFFQFEIIINVLVSCLRFIWIPMLWVYGHYRYFCSAGIHFRRQILIPALQVLNQKALSNIIMSLEQTLIGYFIQNDDICLVRVNNNALRKQTSANCLLEKSAGRDGIKMLGQCWDSVADGGPTLNRHLVNVSTADGCCTADV